MWAKLKGDYHMRLPTAAKLGIAIVGLGLAVPTVQSVWQSTRNFVPVDKAISLLPGHIQQSFTLNFSGDYFMEIQVERKLAHRTLQCLLGTGDVVQGQCNDIAPVLQFAWQLQRAGQMIQSGTSAKVIGGGYSNDTVALEFAAFQGRRGERYILDMDILQDGSRLAIANPKLRVEVDNFTYEDLAVEGFFGLAFAAVCCLVGSAIAIVSIIMARKRQHVVNEPAPSAR